MKGITLSECKKEDIQLILNGINQYNLDKVPALADVWTPIEIVAKNEEGLELGGILSGIGYWNGLEIKILWVKEEFRNKGLGTKILTHAEEIAKEKGATIAMLDTFDFQAEGFYKKQGYEVIGEINDFPKGHKRIYFSKPL